MEKWTGRPENKKTHVFTSGKNRVDLYEGLFTIQPPREGVSEFEFQPVS
jgi:hypothetical protein